EPEQIRQGALQPLVGERLKGGHRAAALYTLVETCKLNEVDPRAWLADVLTRLPEHPAKRLAELLPWNWKPLRDQQAAA
ncbi:transposase domain-containing protein, partial [Microvirga aerilata]|uniref:transposase domain-containing protein n=1 Tax=Microvirga aerilata TaxID=670292 RepID=UPI003623DA59